MARTLLLLPLLPAFACHPAEKDSAEPFETGDPGARKCSDMGLTASYDDVQQDYADFEALAYSQGDLAMSLLEADEVAEFYAMLGPEMVALVSEQDIQDIRDAIFGEDPLGERLDRRSMGLGRLMYDAGTYPWQGIVLGFKWGFDAVGTIQGFAIQEMNDLPEPYTDYESPVRFGLPFDCIWYTAWGGRDELHNYHTYYAPSAYAYDFVVWQDGGTCTEPCAENEDYYAFGKPILAPAEGEVVEVDDSHPDMPPGEMDAAALEGNHVVLQVADGEYLLMAHMQAGSVTVALGDVVQAGQIIGNVGNSGNTSESHLHIHLQDQVSYGPSGGTMPQDFYDLSVNGVSLDRSMPLGGQFVLAGSE